MSMPHAEHRSTVMTYSPGIFIWVWFTLVQAECATPGRAQEPTVVYTPRQAWIGRHPSAPSSYRQSCALNPVCGAPTASGEAFVPAVRTWVETAEAIQGLLTLKDFLDEAEVAHIEEILIQCAKEADAQINNREYPKEGYPSDPECDRVVRYTSQGKKLTRAMELGTMKHEVAFACVERKIGKDVSAYVTREPRYGKTPPGQDYTLTTDGSGSLVPDLVLHLKNNANTIQLLYDFLFPCTSRSKSDPLASWVKLDKYRPLADDGRRALVTPQLGISR